MVGLYAVGDALATTDPAFGRGMSLALAQVEAVAAGLGSSSGSPCGEARWSGER